MGMLEFFRNVGLGFRIGMEHGVFREFLEKERSVACDELANVVQNESPESLSEFEQCFLSHASAVVGPVHRLRAMELYVFFKMQETIHYKTFRGFLGDAGPLTA